MKKIIVLCIVGFSLLGVNVSANDVLIDENGNVITGNANVNDGNLEVLTTGEDAIVGITSGTDKSGVYGESEDSGYGIQGLSNTGIGGYFNSTSGYGLIVETGNVGIGTTSPNPLYKLDVVGTIHASADIKINGVSVLTSFTETDPVFSGSVAFGITSGKITNWDTAFSWGNHASAGYDTSNDTWTGTENVYMTSGNVGIGTTNPFENLHIIDSPGATGDWATGSDLLIDSGALQRYITLRGPNSGQTGILFSNSDSFLDGGIRYWPSSTPGADRLELRSGNTDGINVMGDGNIGIGTTNPSSKLHILGSEDILKISSSSNMSNVNALVIESNGGAGHAVIRNNSPSAAGTAELVLDANTSGGTQRAAALTFQVNSVDNWRIEQNSSPYGLSIDKPGTAGVEMYFDITGNVGIGTTNPTHKLDVNGNLRIENRLRSGSETGTSQGPNYPDQGGMIVRRIQSTAATNGQVVAATDTISFQRDGTNAGFKAVVTGSLNTISCMGIDSSGTNVNSINSGVSNGTYTVYTNAENVVYMSCSFGKPYNALHTTQLTLFRQSGDYYWNGFIMSTYDQ